MKIRILLPAILLALAAGPAARADLTLRYKLTLKAGEGMPQPVAAAVAQAVEKIPAEVVTEIHGDLARSDLMGKAALIDYRRRQITVLDAAEKRFATEPLDDFPNSMSTALAQPPPEAAAALRDMKFDVQNKDTGLIASIDGIRAEESDVVMTISVPGPQGQSLEIRVEVGIWRPLADEMARRPELKEYAAWSARVNRADLRIDMLSHLVPAMAGFAEQMRGAIESLEKTGDRPALRMHAAVSMPGLAKLLGQMREQGGVVQGGLGLAESMMDVNLELAEMSAAPLAEDLFAVPVGFHSVAMKDLMAPPAVATIQPPPAAPHPAAAPIPATPTPEGGVLRVGGGVTAPMLTSKVEPQYSEEARRDHVEGTVVLTAVVGSDGVAHELSVLRSLRPDLDRKAIETVSQWKFRPGEKDGKPVNVQVTVEVNFRLRDNPPAKQQ
jgi:TonB family protein